MLLGRRKMLHYRVRVLGKCSVTCGDALHERFMQLLEARCPKSSIQHRSSCAVGPLLPSQRCNGHTLRCHHMICLKQLYAALPTLSFLLEGAQSLSKLACFCDMLALNVHKVACALCSGAQQLSFGLFRQLPPQPISAQQVKQACLCLKTGQQKVQLEDSTLDVCAPSARLRKNSKRAE